MSAWEGLNPPYATIVAGDLPDDCVWCGTELGDDVTVDGDGDPMHRRCHVASFSDLNPPYATIVVDPPWEYRTTGKGSSRRGVNPGKSAIGYLNPSLAYGSLTLDEIKALPVGDLAANTRLFLWTTNRYLRHAWDVAEAWGFTPQDRTLVWCKAPRCTTPVTTEFVLIAKKGRPEPMPWSGTTWYQWPHQRAHSVKPAAFTDLVESWCPGPYVELFARQPRLGWDHWGHGYESGAA